MSAIIRPDRGLEISGFLRLNQSPSHVDLGYYRGLRAGRAWKPHNDLDLNFPSNTNGRDTSEHGKAHREESDQELSSPLGMVSLLLEPGLYRLDSLSILGFRLWRAVASSRPLSFAIA